ncbi:unnamed protein product [Rotaria magnacalcarata]|uniref:Uncharacterized protein n=1 Tax=Rotaria magnacalcarata TaxID=392030 RepID=A0A819PWG7_9BILA|nr:unnamed protein product [Rotaria magnacalcarata]
MMSKLGYDIVVSKLNDNELMFSQQVLRSYDRLEDIICHRFQAGDNDASRLEGLHSIKMYTIQEINIYRNSLSCDYLMTYGFNPIVDMQRLSIALKLTKSIL